MVQRINPLSGVVETDGVPTGIVINPITGVVTGGTGGGGDVSSSDITDATTTGKAVLTAASAAAARTAIGAGTSSLALGTTASTAKAGNYVPAWADVTAKPFLSVKDYGAKGDNAAVSSVAITAAITAAPAGSTVFFPPGTYLVASTIALKAGVTYKGSGPALAGGATIKQKAAANIGGAILAANVWATAASGSTPVCDLPILIEDLGVDGNKAANPTSTAVGIAVVNYGSHVHRCAISNTPSHGVLLTDTAKSGAVVTNSCSENRVTENKFVSTGGDAVHQVSANGISNQDGFCDANLLQDITGSGMNFDRAAGWSFRRNHLYGIGDAGMDLRACYATTVTENYIEDFGDTIAASGYSAGISMTQLNGRTSVLTGNFVGCNESNEDAGGYLYYSISAGNGETDSRIILTGNTAYGPDPHTAHGTGITLSANDGGSLLTAKLACNDLANIQNPKYFSDGVTAQDLDA